MHCISNGHGIVAFMVCCIMYIGYTGHVLCLDQNNANMGPVSTKLLSSKLILIIQKTMVAMVISELVYFWTSNFYRNWSLVIPHNKETEIAEHSLTPQCYWFL